MLLIQQLVSAITCVYNESASVKEFNEKLTSLPKHCRK